MAVVFGRRARILTTTHYITMEKKHLPEKPLEIPHPERKEEVKPAPDPEEPLVGVPEEIPDFIPDDEPFETPPYELPPLGEGP